MTSSVKFSITCLSNALAIIGSLLVVTYLIFDRTLRQALNNHIIIVLLCVVCIRSVSLLVMTIYLYFYITSLSNPILSFRFSFFIEYGLYTTQIILVVWATIERHILVFHHQWLCTQKKRFFVHYLPIMVILIYCFIYFSLITFAPFCENSLADFIAGDAFNPCTLDNPFLGMWDLILHHVVSTFIIALFSIGLIARVIRQKQRLNRPIEWRKHRKLTIQMLFTSLFYLICNAPWTIIVFALRYGLSYDLAKTPLNYAFMLRDYIVYLYPFICLGSLSELRSKFKALILCWRHRQPVVPDATIEPRAQTVRTKHVGHRNNTLQ